MKTLKNLLMIGLTVSLAAAALNAQAGREPAGKQEYEASGGDASGGGNTYQHKMIERYIELSPEKIRGYKNYQQKLEKIRAMFPVLAESMEERMKEMDWYVIPAKLSQLPFAKTGLSFKSGQPAYQTKTEIFVSDAMIKKMSEDEVGELFIHEALMALQEKKAAEQVRPVVARLLKGASPVEVQSALLKHKFGLYLTPEQVQYVMQNEVNESLQGSVYSELKRTTAGCKSIIPAGQGYEFTRLHDGYWAGGSTKLANQLRSAESNGLGYLQQMCFRGSDKIGKEICRELSNVNANYAVFETDDFVVQRALREKALERIKEEFEEKTQALGVALSEKLIGSNAYLTQLAINDDEMKAKESSSYLHDSQKKHYDKVKTKVRKIRAGIDFTDKASLARLNCSSTQALLDDVRKLFPKGAADIDAEDAEIEARDKEGNNGSAE